MTSIVGSTRNPFKDPNETLIPGDNQTIRTIYDWDVLIPAGLGARAAKRTDYRHGKTINIFWVDGHAGSISNF